MPLPWTDPLWTLTASDPTFACCPPAVGNGLLGTRLGAFVLGTDPDAPGWTGVGGPTLQFTMPRFDPSSPLPVFARFMRDGALLALPSWQMLDLTVDGVRFRPGQGLFRGESRLDLRTGEASLDGEWATRAWTEPGPRRMVRISIRLLLPRTVDHGGFFELSVSGEGATIAASVGWEAAHLPEFGITWRAQGEDLLGDGATPGRQRPVRLGARLALETGTVQDTDLEAARWRVTGENGTLRLALHAAIRGGMEEDDPVVALATDLTALSRGRADGSLRRANAACWQELWSRGLDVTILPEQHRQLVLAQQYHLLASSGAAPWPTGPQGVTGNNWRGQQMWDNDLWTFRALLPLWPELAEPLIAARLRQLPEARRTAQAEGLRGAFLHTCDENGIDVSPADSPYRQELHMMVWPALAVWDLWRATGDRGRLARHWPVLRDVAELFASRCTADADGSWHLRGIVPADEYVCEHGPGTCDDAISTNLAVRAALRAAVSAAAEIGEAASTAWTTIADGLLILAPGADGIIPEYTGYAGQQIKQADVALCFYPLGLELPAAQVLRNLAYYRERCDRFGPLMSAQIDACVLMRGGAREEGLAVLLERYRRHARGTFLVPTEGPANNVATFITGCGGLLQALVYGYTRYREPGDDAALIPRIGAEWPAVNAATAGAN